MSVNFKKYGYKVIQNLEKTQTRFDDIKKEIATEKLEKYYRQNESKVTSTFTLGNVVGNLLDKVV